jgi:hypothetical protein
VAAGAVLIGALLCFLIILSPRLHRLHDLDKRVTAATDELTGMKKEIEDAKIIGGPAVGGARFDKFGILSNDEEQIFLTDLILFCKDSTNTLNLVRRSDYAQATTSSSQQTAGQSQTSGSTTNPQGPPQPVILRVPHTVSFSGTFISSFYLLRKLESYRRLLTVEKMGLTTDSRDGYPKVNGNITIDLYLVKEPAPSAAPPSGQAASASQSAPTG